MGSFNQMCMVSNIPIKQNTSIKLFFLVSEGDSNNEETIMTGFMPSPWSAFKFFGGMSVDAIYRGYNSFEVLKNEKSDYMLSLFKKLTGKNDLDFSKIFKEIEYGSFDLQSSSRENVFMNIACVHNFAYDEMVKSEERKIHLKEMLDRELESIDNLINKDPNNRFESEEEANNFREDMLNWIDVFDNYTPNCIDEDFNKSSFVLYRQYRPDLNKNEVFNKIINDILFMDNLHELGVTVSPRSMNHELASEQLREKIMTKSLTYFMNDYYDEDYVKVKKTVRVIQEITLNNLNDYFNSIDEVSVEVKLSFDKFIQENKDKDRVYIEADNIGKYYFLSNIVQDKQHDILIVIIK